MQSLNLRNAKKTPNFEFNIGERVKVSYNKTEGFCGEIVHRQSYGDGSYNSLCYGVKNKSGIVIEVTESVLKRDYSKTVKEYILDRETRLMKVKSYKMVIIPFEYVPHRVIFRFNNEWWRRKAGTESQAERFVDAKEETPQTTNICFIGKNDLVVTNKSCLEKTIAHAYIVEEFNTNA